MLLPSAPERASGDAPADALHAYENGQYLSAQELTVAAYGPMERWQGSRLRVFAGRLCNQLGAPRRGRAYHFFTHRRNPQDAEAAYFHLSSCVSRQSPMRLLEEARRTRAKLALSDELRSHVLALEANVLALFRDFARAFVALDEAERLNPRDPWIWVERSYVCLRADRVAEAIEHARQALSLHPAYVPAIRQLAATLSEAGRLEEAVDTLREKAADSQAGGLFWQLGALQAELNRHAEAEASFTRALANLVMLEPDGLKSLNALRADTAYMSGQYDVARVHAERAGTPYYARFAERLAQGHTKSGRKVLDVPWVRQKHLTCAPATIASIATYFAQPVDHDAIAKEICYGGTSSHGERAWAERQGFVTREFTVTLDSARALLDRGLPFTLTTVEPTSAHLQAVHGYDLTRETILVRDPSSHFDAEYQAEAFFERYASSGPRGMVFVPRSEAHRLEGLALPDAERYDAANALLAALENFDGAGARRAEARLAALGDHPLLHDARLRLAYYDRDEARRNQALDALLAHFPDDERLVLLKTDALEGHAPLEAREALLERLAAKSGAHPAVVRARAELLSFDVRRSSEARFWYRKALRLMPTDALHAYALAGHSWGERRFEEALELYRFALCLADTNEHYALSYFRAARLMGRTEEALEVLRMRVVRYTQQSARPLESLFEALRTLDRVDEGFQLLEQALREHQDGPLRLFAAEAFACHGQLERADALLQAARGHTAELAWLRVAARVASLQGDAARTKDLWRELADRNPLDLEAQEQLASHINDSEGPEAAASYLADVAARFPHHFPLAAGRLRWAKEAGAVHTEAAIEALRALAPHDAWVQREWCDFLLDARRVEEASQVAEEQVALAPYTPQSWAFAGLTRKAQGRREDAQAAFRRALELAPDYVFSLDSLMDLCGSAEERRSELERFHGVLEREVTQGAGLLSFAAYAREVLSPERLLDILEAALSARPDLVPMHIALSREHAARGNVDRAYSLLEEASRRFAYRSELFKEMAAVCALRRDETGRLHALTRAYEVDPDNADAAEALAEEHLARGNAQAALPLCENALLRHPGHVPLKLVLASARHALGQRERAFAEVERVVTLHPGFERAWNLLERWDEALGRADATLAAAQLLTERRPQEARSFLVLARRLADGEDLEGLARAVRRATELNPELAEAYDILAYAYARRGRWAEALEACSPPSLRDRLPHTLKGRRLWILAQRGSLRDAITGMEELLREVPDYEVGTRWLCDFYERAKDAQGHARAAQRLARLAPNSAPAHGYVAAALLDIDERASAKEHAWKSVALDPSYRYGAALAFDLHLQDEEWEDAERALAKLHIAAPGQPEILRRDVALRAAQKRADAALESFARLLRADGVHAQQVHKAQASLEGSGLVSKLDRVYEEALCDPAVQRPALEPWIESVVADRPLVTLKRVLHANLSPTGAQAVSELVTRVSDATSRWKMRFFLLRNKAALLAHTPIWGAVGYALVCMKAHRQCARWLSDYAARADAEAWHLFNLGLALRHLHRYAAARAVHRHALTCPKDDTTVGHRAWRAFYAALAGDTDEARAELALGAGHALQGHQRFARLLAELMLAADVLARQRAYRLVAPLRLSLVRLLDRTGVDLDQDRPLANIVRRAMRRIARTRPFLQAFWIRLTWEKP